MLGTEVQLSFASSWCWIQFLRLQSVTETAGKVFDERSALRWGTEIWVRVSNAIQICDHLCKNNNLTCVLNHPTLCVYLSPLNFLSPSQFSPHCAFRFQANLQWKIEKLKCVMTWIRKALYVVFLFALQLQRLLSVSAATRFSRGFNYALLAAPRQTAN